METGFSIILLTLVLLFYLSNPQNNANKCCSVAGLIFWLGVAKEAALYNIIPTLEVSFEYSGLAGMFMPVYSVCTWALYSLAMPTTVMFALYFCNIDKTNPVLFSRLKIALYIPALVLSCFFHPLEFRAFQLGSILFWTIYAIYNISLCTVLVFLMTWGGWKEEPGNSKSQKKRVWLVILLPVVFWATSVFLTHPFQRNSLFKLWQVNVFILLGCLVIFIFAAFRDGFMGLKLSGETYDWNSHMNLINIGAEYTGHMLKNQTTKMELCIEYLNSHFSESNEEPPEELAILSHSIATLKNYFDKIKRHSQYIYLREESCRLAELLSSAASLPVDCQHDTSANINVPENMFWVCDKGHMTEVFANILLNAFEAMRVDGVVEISGSVDKTCRNYLLSFKDNGLGMDENELKNMFAPYFTTKSTEKNFGLGLSYCKSVVAKHGGSISATSRKGNGTIVTIAFPVSRTVVGGTDTISSPNP